MPQRGGPVSRAVGRAILKAMRFKLEGPFPDLDRFVLIGGPHTSNWDGVVGYGAALALGLDIRVMAKDALFKGPVGWFLKRMGAIPVNRSAGSGVVEQAVARFETGEPLVLGIAPEGTRGKVKRWKSGFHRIAVAADVPICCVAIDFGRRWVGPGPTFYPSGDWEADLDTVQAFYRTLQGRNPENQ